MAFQDKDLKILWGKAAARCSMPECRKTVVADASDVIPSKAILLGENCHIVAERPGGPRGKSSLNEADRNRYPNLILMCRNHHAVIDQDPDSWSIELLHQIKADHEIWVETQLTEPLEQSAATKYYAEFVNRATKDLILDRWGWVCDNAFRCLLVEEFVDGVNAFCEYTKRAVWPNGYDDIRDALINLSDRLYEYLVHFMTLAMYIERPPGDFGHFQEDRRWKQVWRSDYDEHATRAEKWQKGSVDRLANVVVALNEFAKAVRASINENYFLYQGKFTLLDTMGMTTDGFTPAYYIPEEYIDIES